MACYFFIPSISQEQSRKLSGVAKWTEKVNCRVFRSNRSMGWYIDVGLSFLTFLSFHPQSYAASPLSFRCTLTEEKASLSVQLRQGRSFRFSSDKPLLIKVFNTHAVVHHDQHFYLLPITGASFTHTSGTAQPKTMGSYASLLSQCVVGEQYLPRQSRPLHQRHHEGPGRL